MSYSKVVRMMPALLKIRKKNVKGAGICRKKLYFSV